MALTNAEKQARWRERHIGKRRSAQRVANILVRQKWPDETAKELAVLMRQELRMLKEPTPKEDAARHKRNGLLIQAAWLRQHPGKTIKDYRRLSGDEKFQFLVTMNDETLLAEEGAYERDHPGEQFPEHESGLSDREYNDLDRWRRQRERRATNRRTRADLW